MAHWISAMTSMKTAVLRTVSFNLQAVDPHRNTHAIAYLNSSGQEPSPPVAHSAALASRGILCAWSQLRVSGAQSWHWPQVEVVDVLEGEGGDGVGQGILPVAGVDYPQAFQSQVFNDDVHGFCRARGIGALELEAPTPASPQQHQIQLGASSGAVKVGVALAVGQERLLQGESLPTGAVAWMHRQLPHLFQPQQEMQDSAVAQVDLGRFDDALAKILPPGREHPNHEGARQ